MIYCKIVTWNQAIIGGLHKTFVNIWFARGFRKSAMKESQIFFFKFDLWHLVDVSYVIQKRTPHYEMWHSALVVWIIAASDQTRQHTVDTIIAHTAVIWRACTEDISVWQIYKSCGFTLRNSCKCFFSTSYHNILLRCTATKSTSSDHCNLCISMWYFSMIHRFHGVGKYPPILPSRHLMCPADE